MQSFRHLKLPFLMSSSVCVLMVALGTNLARTADEGKPNEKIRELLKERLVAVVEISDFMLKGFQIGEIPLDQVLQARSSLLTANLELCETKEERVKVLQGMVKLNEELLVDVTKMFEASETNRADVLKAKVQLLEARIGLEKAAISK